MIRAKFVCSQTTTVPSGSEEVKLVAVYSTAGENAQWAKATPQGSISMLIDNPAAIGKFTPGAEYYVDFTPAVAK